MANYNLLYRMSFDDILSAAWRVDFLLKDGPIQSEPIEIIGGATPLKLDKKNNNENRFADIIKTTASITYIYRGGSDPVPETFINIQDDDYLIEVYKNNILDWKGFLNGQNNTYKWLPAPFEFTISATDFTFMDATPVNLNDPILFLYGFITIGDLLNRSLFAGTFYDNPSLNILYTKKPASIGTGLITDSLYIHTDSVYDFAEGVNFITDALSKFLNSTGSRLFYAGGAYWLQYQPDIENDVQNVIVLTPSNINGTEVPNIDTSSVMGNAAGADVVYLDRSAEILINKALKQQTFNYSLKPINQVRNFDWRTDLTSPFDDWEGDISSFYQRVGTGSTSDPFRLHIEKAPGSSFHSIWNRIPVKINQRVDVTFKSRSFLTLPAPDAISYEVYTKALVLLVEAGTLGGTQQRYLTASGEWAVGSGSGGGSGEAEYYHISSRPADNTDAQLHILSNPIPSLPGITDYEILVIIIDSGITPAPPTGSTFYTELYPIFVGIFNNIYVKVAQKIVNSNKFSVLADDQEMFYLDTQDFAYSNALFYDNAGVKTPLPNNDWDGKTIDETVVRMHVDEQARPSYTVMGDFLSNTLQFYQMVILLDKDNKKMMQVRDSYDVRKAKHQLMLIELIPEGTAIATYTKTQLTEK